MKNLIYVIPFLLATTGWANQIPLQLPCQRSAIQLGFIEAAQLGNMSVINSTSLDQLLSTTNTAPLNPRVELKLESVVAEKVSNQEMRYEVKVKSTSFGKFKLEHTIHYAYHFRFVGQEHIACQHLRSVDLGLIGD